MGPRARAPRWIRVPPPANPRPDYLRFVCFQLVDGQRHRLGLFPAMAVARESDQGIDWALAEIETLNDWFGDNLAAPTCFDDGGGERALSWFKPGATEHISRMFALKAALEACGVHVEVLRTRSPGLVRYEDEHQVAAEPYGVRF